MVYNRSCGVNTCLLHGALLGPRGTELRFIVTTRHEDGAWEWEPAVDIDGRELAHSTAWEAEPRQSPPSKYQCKLLHQLNERRMSFMRRTRSRGSSGLGSNSGTKCK